MNADNRYHDDDDPDDDDFDDDDFDDDDDHDDEEDEDGTPAFSTTTVFQGAFKARVDRATGMEKWTLTNDHTLLLDPDADILWVTTLEQLKTELEERYPCPHDGLSRLYWDGYSDHVYIYPHPLVDNHKPDAINRAAKRAGTICLRRSYGCGDLRKKLDHCTVHFGPQGGLGSVTTITYNPKCAAKRRAARVLPPEDMRSIWRSLQLLTWDHLPQLGILGGQSRLYYLTGLRRVLWLTEKVYGKGSFRYLRVWHDFVVKWRDHQAATEKALTKDVGTSKRTHPHYLLVHDIIPFMQREVKRKLPPPEAEKVFTKRAVTIVMPC